MNSTALAQRPSGGWAVRSPDAPAATRATVARLCDGLEPRRPADRAPAPAAGRLGRPVARRSGRALAERLRLSRAEVYEVATFYHHFRVLDDGAVPPRVTVRVCTSLPCAQAGGEELLARVRCAGRRPGRGGGGGAVHWAVPRGKHCVEQRQVAPAPAEAVTGARWRAAPRRARRTAHRSSRDYAQLERLCLRRSLRPIDVLRS